MGTDRRAEEDLQERTIPQLREDAAEDLAAIKEDWGAIWNDFDQMRMDADFDF